MSFEIKRWDVIIINNRKIPIIYIEPTIAFLDFIKDNNYIISCKIFKTNTVYDDKNIIASVDRSSFIPNYRPNFFNKYNYYIVTLLTATWNGYPDPSNLGILNIDNIST